MRKAAWKVVRKRVADFTFDEATDVLALPMTIRKLY